MDGAELREAAPTRGPEGADEVGRPSTELPALCPYLATTDGTWRSANPAREHRCVAVTPPVPLAMDKQRRLCLVAGHEGCATYQAALAARPPYALAALSRGRVIARTTPVVLDQTRFDLRIPALRSDRVSGQALLVGLLALAFVAILISRPSGNGGAAIADGSEVPSASTATLATPTPRSTPRPSAVPVVTARPVTSGQPVPTTSPSSSTPSAQPTLSGATYTIKRGDTLSAIAARFGTTVKVLVTLNHISDPSRIHAGQVLTLP